MGLELDYIFGQTPIDEEEKEGLLIETISTKKELDEFEQKNIEQAIQWLIGRKLDIDHILSEAFVKLLHKRMYGEVWSWAGEFRKSDKNIGITSWRIPTELKVLLDDTKYWIENNTYSNDEIAIRFKHRLVSIHCFSNGNGRHSRLMADIIIEKIFNEQIFNWGNSNLSEGNENRREYLNAIKLADQGNVLRLLGFARG